MTFMGLSSQASCSMFGVQPSLLLTNYLQSCSQRAEETWATLVTTLPNGSFFHPLVIPGGLPGQVSSWFLEAAGGGESFLAPGFLICTKETEMPTS